MKDQSEQNQAAIEEPPKEEQVRDYPLKGIPNIDFYQKTYGKSCGNNDEKAVKVFKEYENQDRVRRVKAELIGMSLGKVSPELCEKILGKSRKAKYENWEKWAAMMIATFNSKR